MSSGKRIGSIIGIPVFLAGFTAMNLAVGIFFPFRQDFFIQIKFDELRASSAPYDLLFIGPSTTYNHINSELFEDRLKASGRAVHAFNFGTPAMHLCEAYSIVRQVAVMDDLDIKWVFFDLDLANSAYDHDPFTRRFIAWHDLSGMVCDIRTTFSTDRNIREKLTRLYHSIRAFVYHSSNAGAPAQLIRDRAMPPTLTKEERKYAAASKQGFLAMDQGTTYNSKKSQKYLLALSQYRQHMVYSGGINADDGDFLKIANGVVYLKRMVDLLDAQSIQSVFFVSPDLNRDDAYLDDVFNETGKAIFAFNDIDAYPDLYQVDYRFGVRHLNGTGAKRLTELLAEQFSRYLDKTGR